MHRVFWDKDTGWGIGGGRMSMALNRLMTMIHRGADLALALPAVE